MDQYAVPVVWSPETRRHDPRHELWVGVATDGTERAQRVDAILEAVRTAGHELVEATPQPDDALLDVHDPELLEFLRTAAGRWAAGPYRDLVGQERVVPALPDHVVVRLVTEDRDVPAADQLRQAVQVLGRRYAAGGVVRRVEEDRLGLRLALHEALDVVQIRTKLILLLERRMDDAPAAAGDVRLVGRELRREKQDGIRAIEKCLAEELLEHLCAGADDDVFRANLHPEFLGIIGRERLAKLGQAH